MKSLYFQGEVIVSQPKQHPDRILIRQLAENHDFIMVDDAMMTYCASTDEKVKEAISKLVPEFLKRRIAVQRYRMSEVWIDSNGYDTLKIL
jgi:hypothetical protein